MHEAGNLRTWRQQRGGVKGPRDICRRPSSRHGVWEHPAAAVHQQLLLQPPPCQLPLRGDGALRWQLSHRDAFHQRRSLSRLIRVQYCTRCNIVGVRAIASSTWV